MLCDKDNKKLTLQAKCLKAGISRRQAYTLLKTPNFIKALKLNNVAIVISESPMVIQSLLEKAKMGSFNHSKLALELSGDYTPQQVPLIHQVINTFNKEGITEQDLDDKLTKYFSKGIIDTADSTEPEHKGNDK